MEEFDKWLDKVPFLKLDEALVTEMLTYALHDEVTKAGFKRVVLGLSGGIDSALSLYLAVQAFGAENVLAVCMPYRESNPASLKDAETLIKATGVESVTIDITPQIDAYFAQFPEATPLRRGNKMARERMGILYDLSAEREALVIGTSNKTELLLGYGTQFGDMASAINPIGDLYKTQVRQLSVYLGIPESVITKPPSGDLWKNQTDEEELGFTYEEVDPLLYYLVDLRYSKKQLIAQGFEESLIEQVMGRIERNHYKRWMPIILKVSGRTIGFDFRYLRDTGL